jgi:phosphate transport system permease protein
MPDPNSGPSDLPGSQLEEPGMTLSSADIPVNDGESSDSFPKRKKRKKVTPWRVKLIDQVASQIITVGGIGTIAAVLLVVAVLVTYAWPLLSGAQIGRPIQVSLPSSAEKTVQFGCDEYRSLAWLLNEDISLSVVDLADGTLIKTFPLDDSSDGEPISADAGLRITATHAFEPTTDIADAKVSLQGGIIGLSNGEVRTVEVRIDTSFQDLKDLDNETAAALKSNSRLREGERILELLPGSLVRTQQIASAEISPPLATLDAAVKNVDGLRSVEKRGSRTTTTINWGAVTATDVHFGETASSVTRMSKKPKLRSQSASLSMDEISDTPLVGVVLNDSGNAAFVASSDGRLTRLILGGDEPPKVAMWEQVGTSELVRLDPLLGRGTVLAATADGNVYGAFVSRSESSTDEGENERLQVVHRIDLVPGSDSNSAISEIAVSPQGRLVAASNAKGLGGVGFVPTDHALVDFEFPTEGELLGLTFAPKGDAILAVSKTQLTMASFDPGYPEATFRSLFRPVWYEGYDSPRYIWQSSAATMSAESKLSMLPLIYGTLKATLYTMLISIPLALMAAIYSSEFADKKWRGRIKPTLELMASIPSVVLGFVAALVLAPLFREGLSWVLASLVVIPLGYLLTSCAWVLLPVSKIIRLNWLRVPLMIAVFPIAVLTARPIGNLAEDWMFGGDVVRWLSQSSDVSPSVGGWFLILLPLSLLVISAFAIFALSDWTRSKALSMSTTQFALFNALRFVVGAVVTVAFAYGLSYLAAVTIGDLRGNFLDVYQERNALLVGAVLGFAVIPIIYTISDDALQAVPNHLRSASLGCGATPWQTTIRIVVPTAMSGLFSAVMVGFGRAIGETMVVLMAAGNTPIMELNPFNGYRTLSATLATELPEAAKGSTHFRTLFLAALLLFIFALIVNTAAEYVRMRFRKRAYQL